MYEYDRGRNVDEFVEFVTGKYETVTGKYVPPPVGGWKKVIRQLRKKVEGNKFLSALLEDFEHILSWRKNAAILLFVFGGIFGFFNAILMSALTRQKKLKKA